MMLEEAQATTSDVSKRRVPWPLAGGLVALVARARWRVRDWLARGCDHSGIHHAATSGCHVACDTHRTSADRGDGLRRSIRAAAEDPPTRPAVQPATR